MLDPAVAGAHARRIRLRSDRTASGPWPTPPPCDSSAPARSSGRQPGDRQAGRPVGASAQRLPARRRREPAVASQLNWFANHPDFLERTLGRAELWLYYIVGQLEQRKMPRELALLPVIESAFEPYAYSRARASGLWQFISDTGRRFGLKQDWWYDGRRDPIEATRAALDYLQALHDEFDGDWLLAIAAYNCGELAVERAIERNQPRGQADGLLASEAPDGDARLRARTAGDAPAGREPGSAMDWNSVASRTSPISCRSPPAARSTCRSWPISPASASRICTAQPRVSSLCHRPDRPESAAGAGGCRRGPGADTGAAHARAAHARGALYGAARRYRGDHREPVRDQARCDPRTQ